MTPTWTQETASSDITSLYPYVTKYALYPQGHPRIVASDYGNIGEYFGIAKATISPHRGLLHPWCTPELDQAVITKIHEVLQFDQPIKYDLVKRERGWGSARNT